MSSNIFIVDDDNFSSSYSLISRWAVGYRYMIFYSSRPTLIFGPFSSTLTQLSPSPCQPYRKRRRCGGKGRQGVFGTALLLFFQLRSSSTVPNTSSSTNSAPQLHVFLRVPQGVLYQLHVFYGVAPAPRTPRWSCSMVEFVERS
jgi:hypothetical protein